MATATAELVTASEPDDDFYDIMLASYNNPLFFFRHALFVEPRRWQREVLEEIGERRRAGELHTKVHIRTCHQSGKTFLSGGLAVWWCGTRPGSRVLTTAPTWKGVKDYLWNEIHKLYQGSIFAQVKLGRMLDVEWDMGEGWFATGAASDNPANLEGQGSSIAAGRFVDEAKTVVDGVFIATQGMLASPETLDVWISTPSIRSGRFYERDMESGDELIRKVVTIDDLIADGVEGKAHWKEEALREYGGEGSFEYQSRACAQYIDNAEGALIPFSWIERAMLTDDERKAKGLPVWHVGGPATLGYDVAGSKDGDENAIAPGHGPDHLQRYEVDEITHWHERDTMVSRDKVLEFVRATHGRCVRADVQGLGKGVCDAIAEKRRDKGLPFSVEEHRSADPPQDPLRFVSKKAEDNWSLRIALEKDLVRLPKSAILRKQMAAMKYEVKNGLIRVVDPDDSPDHWDAVVIAIGGPYHSYSPDSIGTGGETTMTWASPAGATLT
jgi:hypothetical protein